MITHYFSKLGVTPALCAEVLLVKRHYLSFSGKGIYDTYIFLRAIAPFASPACFAVFSKISRRSLCVLEMRQHG